MHGVHHDYPYDDTRLVMPPAISISGAVLVFGLLYVTVGLVTMLPLFAGVVFGYIIYDSVHWYTHAGRPDNRFLKYLRREHLIHHFKHSETRFGVSCPWWDYVFGTAGESHPRSSAADGD
jgi:sterol desaturase/sphingolipid hydroxylase (fatty acid hydroxylase superfamily)